MGIKITGTFVPGGEFPLVEDSHLKGGLRVVETTQDRDNIPELDRKFGMLVYVMEDKKLYQLLDDGSGDVTNNILWKESALGSGSGALKARLISRFNIDLSGTPTIDGVDTQANDIIAVFGQTDSTQNGFYKINQDGTWERTLLKEGDHAAGILFIVEEGNDYHDTLWLITNDEGSDVVGTDGLSAKPLTQNEVLVKNITVRLCESQFNVDFNNPPKQLDYTDYSDGDWVCLLAQNDKRQNGIWVVDSQNGWYRPDILKNGTSVAGLLFTVEEGCLNQDTLWLFINDPGKDIIGTDEIEAKKVSYDGSIEYTEIKTIQDVDEANQFFDLEYTPLPNYHFELFLNGQLLNPEVDYTLSGKRVSFLTHIQKGDLVSVYYRYIVGEHCVPPAPPSPYFEFEVTYQQDNSTLNISYIGYNNNYDNIEIDWGDGSKQTFGTDQTNVSHTYASLGTYRVKIKGFSWIRFNDDSSNLHPDIIVVKHWGDMEQYQNLGSMFANMEKISLDTDDILNPSNPVSADSMFKNSPNFNSEVNKIKFDNITSINHMFSGAESFNQDVSGWDVSNLTELQYVFQNAKAFNQNINTWNVSNITNMEGLFDGAQAYNQPMDTWDTSNVTNMKYMFRGTANFDQDISGWNVDKVTECDEFRWQSALSCDHTPDLPASCTGCFNDFKFKVTVNSGESMWFGNIQSKGDTDLIVDWGDGTIDNLGTTYNNNLSHTYNAGGTYTVKIHGHKRIKMQGYTNPVEIIHWGDNRAWEDLSYMFASMTQLTINTDDILSPVNEVSATHMFNYCRNLNCNLDQYIDTKNFTQMDSFLAECNNFNGTVNGFNISKITSLNKFFYNCFKFNQPVDNWDTSNVTDMSYCFYRCYNFNQPLNTWNTSKVTNMTYMFNQAVKFNQDLDKWDTSNVTNMAHLFDYALAFNGDVSTWDTSNVTTMESIFQNAQAFNQDISNWNTSKNTTLRRAFYNCYVFNQDLSKWDVSNVTTLYQTFYSCKVFNQPLDNWDTSNVTDMTQTFYHCAEFNQPLNSWNISKVTTLYGTFDGCVKFNQDLNNWDTSNVKTLYKTFNNCQVFNGDITTWNTSNVTNMYQTFNNCYNFNQPIGNWDVSKVTTFYSCFSSCANFNQPLNNWNTGSATNMQNMFLKCSEFNQDLDKWDVSNVTNMSGMFRLATKFDGNISTWNTSNVTSMNSMFSDAHSFNQPLNDWDVSNVTDMSYMFERAYNFNRPLNNWNTGKVTKFNMMFHQASAFNQDISTWNTSSAVDMSNMFNGASSFNQPLNSWTLTNVTTIANMFYGCSKFNQDLNNWDTKNITSMHGVFTSCTAFNGDISTWNTSNVTDMSNMFQNANQFNRDISGWDVSNVTNMSHMFENADSFNIDISSWDTSNVTDMSYMFNNNDAFDQDISGWNVSNVQYCSNFRGGTSVLQCSHTPALPAECTGC